MLLTELTEKNFYHGSMDELPIGTILVPGEDEYEENWSHNLWFQALENHWF